MPSARAPHLLAAVLIAAGILTSGTSGCERATQAADTPHYAHVQPAAAANDCSTAACERDTESDDCQQVHCPMVGIAAITATAGSGTPRSGPVAYLPSFPDSQDAIPDPPPPRALLG